MGFLSCCNDCQAYHTVPLLLKSEFNPYWMPHAFRLVSNPSYAYF